VSDTVHFRDFSKKRGEVNFNIDDQRFDCFKAINPKKLQRAINAFRGIQKTAEGGVNESNFSDLLERVTNTMVFFLKPESYERFDTLVNDEDADEPVDIGQLVEILTWLLGDVYAARPTKPSSESTTTSPSDGIGTSSTAGAQLEESIL
jgi:hypothetical protein